MSKLKFILARLPALLGWVALASAIAFVTAMFVHPARAAEPAQAQDYTCTPHKTVLGFTWGWDCAVPRYTTRLTLTTSPSTIWCDESGSQQQCKTSGQAALRIDRNALAGLIAARKFDLAIHCTTTPGDPDALCKFAIESGDAK